MTKKKLHMALLAAVLLSVVFAAAVFGTGREAPLPGLPVSSAGGTLSLLAESGHGPYIAYSQNGAGQLCLLDPATSDMSTLTVNSPILSAACREGNLVVVTEEYGLLCTIAFSPTLEQTGHLPAPDMAADVSLFDCTAQGNLYTVLNEEETTLYYHTPESSWSHDFKSPIRLLHITENGQLWVCTADACYAGDAQNPESLRPITGGRPARVLGSNVFMDSGGTVWRIMGDSSTPTLTGLPPGSLCCADSTGVTYTDETGRIHRLLWDGTEQGSCIVTGTPLALTTRGVLYEEDGAHLYALLDFTPQEEPPAPTPTASSSLAPEPSLEPSPSLEPEPSIAPSPSLEPSPIGPDWLDAYRKHGYYYITGTIPIKSLIEVSKPDSILLHTADGQLIEEGSGLESGPLCTGMTVIQDDEIIARIVVCGDCDGNGRLTSADMHEAQMFLLQGAEDADECRFLAADHDDDGEITTKDLLWLSSQLESP